MSDAACARPEHRDVDFHPTRGEATQPALTVCAACPVLAACRDYIDATEIGAVGIWAGETARARRQRRRDDRRGAA